MFLYQKRGKNSFLTFLNHGKAFAIKKAIISSPEPVSQFLVSWKSLESSFGTNFRFAIGLGNLGSLEFFLLATYFKLDILDDCKCSEELSGIRQLLL